MCGMSDGEPRTGVVGGSNLASCGEAVGWRQGRGIRNLKYGKGSLLESRKTARETFQKDPGWEVFVEVSGKRSHGLWSRLWEEGVLRCLEEAEELGWVL